MAVTSIEMISETNSFSYDDYDEPPQGSTYELVRVYRIANDDSDDQFFKFVIELDSYGNVGGNYSTVEDCIPKAFAEVKPQQETRTVFK